MTAPITPAERPLAEGLTAHLLISWQELIEQRLACLDIHLQGLNQRLDEASPPFASPAPPACSLCRGAGCESPTCGRGPLP